MTELSVGVDGAELHVEVVGHGPPLVLVHGLGLSGELWHRVRDGLGAERRLVLVDYRSAGRGRELERRELTLARWASDLATVVDVLGLERPAVTGHSLGAAIALRFALEYPEAAGPLVLICAEADLSNLAPRMLASAERVESLGMEGWVDGFWAKNPPFAASSLEREPAILDEYRALLLANDPADYARQCRAIATAEDLGGRLGEVEQPVLVLVGGKDDRTLPEHGRELARSLRRARLVELPEAGHTIPLEAPAETVEAVNGFLRSPWAAVEEHAPLDDDGSARILRADTTPRNSREGPFGHLDVRFVVGAEQGASLVAFGQSTYPSGATHENHFHPNADEVVMVVSGRGTQNVGAAALDLGPGDVCLIPRGTAHRITGTSDEDLVILWAFGGAASIEQAGYVPLPDDTGGAT